jgi:hypothetical protein
VPREREEDVVESRLMDLSSFIYATNVRWRRSGISERALAQPTA